MKLSETFEPGHRKTTMTLIALIGSILLENYGGGLGDLKEVILSILAIFTGGNVLSKGIRAVEEVKKSQRQEVETIFADNEPAPQKQEEPAQPAVDMALVNKIIEHVNKLDSAAGAEIKSLKEADAELSNKLVEISDSVKGVSDRLDVQVKNLSQVLNIINGMRNGQQAT